MQMQHDFGVFEFSVVLFFVIAHTRFLKLVDPRFLTSLLFLEVSIRIPELFCVLPCSVL